MVCRFRGELLGVEVFGKGLPTLEIIIGGRCCLGIEEVGFFFSFRYNGDDVHYDC